MSRKIESQKKFKKLRKIASEDEDSVQKKEEVVSDDSNPKDTKKPEFVPVNKTFRKVQILLLAKEKAMKHWDMKDITFSDKIRNIHVTEGNKKITGRSILTFFVFKSPPH